MINILISYDFVKRLNFLIQMQIGQIIKSKPNLNRKSSMVISVTHTLNNTASNTSQTLNSQQHQHHKHLSSEILTLPPLNRTI